MIEVRLAEIDAPEYKQPYSNKAKWFTMALAAQRKSSGQDRTGALPYDLSLNHALVNARLAWWYKKD